MNDEMGCQKVLTTIIMTAYNARLRCREMPVNLDALLFTYIGRREMAGFG